MIHDIFRLSYIIIASIVTIPGTLWVLSRRMSDDDNHNDNDTQNEK